MPNPIKTPEEMLLEMAGIPRYAGGSSVGPFAKRIAQAVTKYKQMYGKEPTAQELQALERHVAGLSQPTSGLRTGMSAQPRAAFELGTDPNLINPDTARDEFLTKMTTGRTNKGTRLRPITQDITDPSVMKNIEAKQMSGELDEVLPNPQSITPSADYFGEVSTNIENAALQGGTLDKLKQTFYSKNGRFPDEDELNAMVAEFNPARHQYGSEGVGILGSRPATAKGMSDWRNQARNEGIPETLITNPPADYPQYAKDELTIQRGEVPTSAIKESRKRRATEIQPTDFYVDENGNLVKVYPAQKAAGGHMSPEEMRHMMLVNGKTPQKFSNGGTSMNADQMIGQYLDDNPDPYGYAPTVRAYEPGIYEKAADKIAPLLVKMGMSPRRAYEQASTIVNFEGGMDPYGPKISPAMVVDPLSPIAAVESAKRGDLLDTILYGSAIPAQATALKGLGKMGIKKLKK